MPFRESAEPSLDSHVETDEIAVLMKSHTTPSISCGHYQTRVAPRMNHVTVAI